jgi:cytochrome c oxidase subunit I+III
MAKEFEVMRGKPTGWRSTLTVSTKEGRPEGVAWIPGPTIWPLALSVSFCVLFTGALINSASITGIGVLTTAVSIGGWFWPTRSQQRAIDEMRGKGYRVIPDRPPGTPLPLVIGGRGSTGWWGMMVVIAVLAVTLLTLVASYFYLALRWTTPPAIDTMEMIIAAAGASFMLVGAGVLHLTTRAGTGALARRRVGLVLATIIGLAALGLVLAAYAYRETSFTRALDAHGSLVYTLLGFQGAVTLGGLVLMTVAQLWLWRRPEDPRGDAVTELAVPYWYFVTASSVSVFLTLYV